MAKIDVTKIEGYSEMTLEQKISALESFEYEDNSSEVERYKAAVSKANSESAEWKRKYNNFLSEEELKKNADEEEKNAIKAELETLKKEKTISEMKVKLLGMGYDEVLATDTAQAMASGDTEKVFSNQRKFLDTREKIIKKEMLQETPNPVSGPRSNTLTKDDFKKMGLIDKQKLASENPEMYKKLTEE